MHRQVAAVFLLLVSLSTVAQVADTSALPTGVVIPKVQSLQSSDQSYALYLPKSYSRSRTWPIVYAFDPGAQGVTPVELMKEAAEKYGYIVVGSNNSRNGSGKIQNEAANDMWNDTHARFAIDEKRVYFTGFSGGARLATQIAAVCNGCAAGVISHGAGFPQGFAPDKKFTFAYFGIVGDRDMNWPEFVALDKSLADAGMSFRIRHWDAEHAWATKEIVGEACQWMELQAMRTGTRPKDEILIAQSFQAASDRAFAYEKANDPLNAYREYRAIAAEFNGLHDVSAAAKRATELKDSKPVKDALRAEAKEVERQYQLSGGAEQALADLGKAEKPVDFTDAYQSAAQQFQSIKQAADYSKKAGDRNTLIAHRAMMAVLVEAVERGQAAKDSKNYKLALLYFQLVADYAKAAPGAHLARAKLFALTGDTKKVVPELQKAVQDGLSDPALLDATEFASLREDPQFKAVRASMETKTP